MGEFTYVYFPQEIAGFLKSEKLNWSDFWPALSEAANRGEAVSYETNTIEFAYDPAQKKYKIAVTFGDKDEVWLTEQEFTQEVPKWVAH